MVVQEQQIVLIVAKCIVNAGTEYNEQTYRLSINSSKVYCKFYKDCFRGSKCICINSSKVYCK